MILNVIANRKGHFDPICMAFPLVTTILAVVFIFSADPKRLSSFDHYLLVIFIFMAMISVLFRIVKHGFTIWSAVPIFFMFLICMFMLRFAFGAESPYDQFLVRNAIYILPTIAGFTWINNFLP